MLCLKTVLRQRVNVMHSQTGGDMSRHINPKNGSKEQFLEEYGLLIDSDEARSLAFADIPKESVLVCLIKNGAFTAATIIEIEQELKEVQDPRDRRQKQFFFVAEKDLGEEATADPFEAMRRLEEKGELRHT